MFKGLHPPGTAEANLGDSRRVGKLEDRVEPQQELATQWSPDMRNDNDIDQRRGRPGETQAERIARARSQLIGVNSIASLDDLEVSPWNRGETESGALTRRSMSRICSLPRRGSTTAPGRIRNLVSRAFDLWATQENRH